MKTKICKNCSKTFNVKDNRQVFCSHSCSASYNNKSRKLSPEALIKMRAVGKLVSKKNLLPYVKIKTYACKVCGKEFTIKDVRNCSGRTYCSAECKHKYLSKHTGGYRKGSGRSKHGWYKGYYLDSTYELVYLIYHLDHNIPIKRCSEVFKYTFNGVEHEYHPDFIVNDTIIEIKGFKSNITDVKLDSVDKPIKILFKDDLKDMFSYVKTKYGTKNYASLYDNYKPKFTYTCDNCLKSFETDTKRNSTLKFCSQNCSGKYRAIKLLT